MHAMLEESKVIATDKSKPENPYVCLVFLDTSSTRPTRRVPFQPDQRGAKSRANRSIPRHPRMWDSRIFPGLLRDPGDFIFLDRKSTRLNSSHVSISYAVFCLKKKTDKYQ